MNYLTKTNAHTQLGLSSPRRMGREGPGGQHLGPIEGGEPRCIRACQDVLAHRISEAHTVSKPLPLLSLFQCTMPTVTIKNTPSSLLEHIIYNVCEANRRAIWYDLSIGIAWTIHPLEWAGRQGKRLGVGHRSGHTAAPRAGGVVVVGAVVRLPNHPQNGWGIPRLYCKGRGRGRKWTELRELISWHESFWIR